MFNKIFLRTDFAQGMILKSQRSRKNTNSTVDVDRGYKHVENFRGGLSFDMMDSKHLISINRFELKYQDGGLVSFNGQSFTFRLSIKEI